MKRFSPLGWTFLLSLLLGCSRSNSLPPGLTGNWKLIREGGGFVGTIAYTGPPSSLRLQTDHRYSRYLNGSLKESGIYSLSTVNVGGHADTILKFISTDTSYRKSIGSSGTEMLLIDFESIYAEPFEEIFQKVP